MFSKYKVNSVSHDNIIGSNETVDSSKKDEVHKQRELDAQRALNETGFGKFNYKVILVTGLICMNVAFSITAIGFILPSAACDFHMTTIDKGRLSAAPIFGMVIGACLWGCIADTKGRRTTLLYCLFIQALFDGLASIISNYWGFIVFKFISGLAMSGQLAILYTYVGEFQPENYRGKAMSFMEMPWVLGMMLVPVLAWVTLSLDIDVSNSIISFKSWNLFTAMSSLPALIVGLLLLRLPETPKYLAERSRYTELRYVLHAMYRENTGKPTEEYIAKMRNAGITFLTDRSIDSSIEKGAKRESVLEAFRKFFPTLYTQTMILLKPPYIGRTLITCIGSYCIFGAIYTLMLWFPELFHRFADFEAQHPNETASVCIVSQMGQKLLANNDSVTNSTLSIDNQTNVEDFPAEAHCDSTIETQVYIHTLILAVSCVPVALIFLICADRFGFRIYLVFNSFGCCALVLSMIFVTNSTQNLVISCIYEALVSLSVTVIYCISVEIFPTHLRVTGSALASLFGRLGSLIGNLLFGFLMDDHCLVLISIVAVELFVAGVLSFFLKNSDDETKEKASPNVPEIVVKHSVIEKYTRKNECSIIKYYPSVTPQDDELFFKLSVSFCLDGSDKAFFLLGARLILLPNFDYYREIIATDNSEGKCSSISLEAKGSHSNHQEIKSRDVETISDQLILVFPVKIENDDSSRKFGIAESVAEHAVNETGFGKFNYKIMSVCGLIYMNYGFGMGSLSLVIPTAACDFEMTTVDKSRPSLASVLGMLCGAYLWACVADVKGRKFTLITALLLHGVFDTLSAIASNYWLFVMTKFFSGLGMSGQLALIFTYLGEFQPTHVRDRILSWMELAWAIGFTIVPAIGWAVVPLDFGFRSGYFFFNSWNLFILICSMPALMIALLMYFLPETPKYLAESGQYAELLKVLENMYSANTGLPSEEYTIKISKIGDPTLDELIKLARMKERATRNVKTFGAMMSSFLRQTLLIFKPPYLVRTLIIGTVMTCLMSSYFTMVLWLPEVFNRFATFEALYPDETANVCSVTAALRRNVTNDLISDLPFGSERAVPACEMGIKSDVYLHSIILGITSVPTAIWLPLFIERLGYVFHLALGSLMCSAVTLGLFFVKSSLQNLVLACIFDAAASICITALLCMLVELYPTNLRVMAAAFSTFLGRIGCFAGNGLFGYLIDDYCVPLISIIAGQLFLSGILSMFIPRKDKK